LAIRRDKMKPQGLREFYTSMRLLDESIRCLRNATENPEHIGLAAEYARLALLQTLELERCCKICLSSVTQHIESALQEMERGEVVTAKELLFIARDKLWHYDEQKSLKGRLRLTGKEKERKKKLRRQAT